MTNVVDRRMRVRGWLLVPATGLNEEPTAQRGEEQHETQSTLGGIGGRSGGVIAPVAGTRRRRSGAELRHGPGLERQRPRRLGRRWPAAERCGAAHGHGAGRRLRRCELDRRRARALPRRSPGRIADGVDGCCGRHRGLSRAGRARQGAGAGASRRRPRHAPDPVRPDVGSDPRRPGEDARHRGRSGGGDGDARGSRRRRPLCAVPAHGRHRARRVAAGSAGDAIDPNSWISEVDPFTLLSTSQFRTPGPRNLNSAAYAHEYNEVKSLGAVTARATRSRRRSPASSTSARWRCSTVRSGPSPRRRG